MLFHELEAEIHFRPNKSLVFQTEMRNMQSRNMPFFMYSKMPLYSIRNHLRYLFQNRDVHT
jgi:hypothetical protein